MATSGVEVKRSEVQLKHLGFVKMLAINAVVLVLKLYGCAKHKCGLLESTVGKVEVVVTALVGPMYYKFKEVPSDVLIFLDNKVDEASYIFDKHAPPRAKNVVLMVKKVSDFVKESPISGVGQVSQEVFDKIAQPIAKDMVQEAKVKGTSPLADKISSSIFNEGDLPIAKGVVSKAKKALVQEGKISKKSSNMFGVGSIFKKTSDLGPVGIFDEAAGSLSIAKGLGSMVTKASDVVQEGISHAGKEASHILDEGASSIAKGVGSMVEKTSDLVQKGPIDIFDEYAPPIAKNVLSKARSAVKAASDLVEVAKVKGPFAAISHAGNIFKEFAVTQLVMVWFKASQYSFLFGILEILIPIAAVLLKKYNSLVKHLRGKGWSSLFSYVPLVPVEELELAYKLVETADVAARKSSEIAAAAKKSSETGS